MDTGEPPAATGGARGARGSSRGGRGGGRISRPAGETLVSSPVGPAPPPMAPANVSGSRPMGGQPYPAVATPAATVCERAQQRKPRNRRSGADSNERRKDVAKKDTAKVEATPVRQAASCAHPPAAPAPAPEPLAPWGGLDAEAAECLQRQVAELQLLLAIDADGIEHHERLGEQLAEVQDSDHTAAPAPALLQCAFTLASTAPVFRDGVVSDAPCQALARVTLPRRYPSSQPPLVMLDGNDVPREVRNELLPLIKQTGAEAVGGECLQQLIDACRTRYVEVMLHIAEDAAEADAERAQLERDGGDAALEAAMEDEATLGRRCVYYHHIIGVGKRQCIAAWARQFGINGFARIGYPGILVIEGPECAVAEYVRRLQRLRWKYMAVRGEETLEAPRLPGKTASGSLDAIRTVPRHGVIEMADATEIAERCRAAGIEELFLTSMKKFR